MDDNYDNIDNNERNIILKKIKVNQIWKVCDSNEYKEDEIKNEQDIEIENELNNLINNNITIDKIKEKTHTILNNCLINYIDGYSKEKNNLEFPNLLKGFSKPDSEIKLLKTGVNKLQQTNESLLI